MPPWTTLAKLPWGTILEGTAALLKRANDLRASRVTAVVVPPEPSSDLDTLRQRLAEFEKQQRADAEIIQQLALQIETVAARAQAMEQKGKQAYLLAIAGVTFGVIGILVGWFRGGGV